ncbi:uncharacterized protein [Amphiura filiformis]
MSRKGKLGDMKAFQKESLVAHNKARDKHGVPHLKLNEELNSHAQKWADHLASTNAFKHSENHAFGENICMHYSSDKPDYSGQEVTDFWYAEIAKFDFKNPAFKSGTGHFSQVVWKDSKELGIGKAITNSGKIIIVGNYKPPGNIAGRYKDNIFPVGGGDMKKGGAGSADGGKNKKGDVPKVDKNEVKNFQKECLQHHNEYRKKHKVEVMKMSEDLCKSAQSWAEHLAQNDLFEHSDRSDIGENVAMHFSSATTAYSGKECSDHWYAELRNYDFKKPGFSNGTGHFTQMVWKASKEFGIGKAITRENKVILVGQYKPPGNVIGQYEDNVFPRDDGFVPPAPESPSKVTRVVRTTQYVVEEPPRSETDKKMDVTVKKINAVKLDEPDLCPKDVKTYQKDLLEAHNKLRKKHNAKPLKHSKELEKRAQDWAAHLAKEDLFKNSGESDVGENIAMHYNSATTDFSGDQTAEMWYKQKEKYDFGKPGFTSGAGHFTQMVWKDSKEFGAGKAITKEGKVILVGFYKPAGNVMRQFEENVENEK